MRVERARRVTKLMVTAAGATEDQLVEGTRHGRAVSYGGGGGGGGGVVGVVGSSQIGG